MSPTPRVAPRRPMSPRARSRPVLLGVLALLLLNVAESRAQDRRPPDIELPDVIITGREMFTVDRLREDDYVPEADLPELGLERDLAPPLRKGPAPARLTIPSVTESLAREFDTVLVLTQGNYTTNFFDGAHTGRLPPWDYFVHVQENYTSGHRDNSRFWDVMVEGEAGYRLDDIGRFFLRTDNLIKSYEIPLAADADEAFIRAHQSQVTPGFRGMVGEDIELEIEPFFSYSTLFTRDRSILPPGAEEDDDDRRALRYGVRGASHFRLPFRQRLTVGGFIWREDVDSEESNIEYTNNVARFFIEDEINWTETLSTTIGLAYDHHESFEEQLSQLYAISWRPLEKTEFYASAEQLFTTRTFGELYVFPNYVEVNDELKPEQEWLFRLGVRGQPHEDVRVKTELFRRQIEDYIFYQEVIPGGDLEESDGLWQPRNLGDDVVIQGVELKVDYRRWEVFQPYIVYRYNDTENEDGTDRVVPFVPEHELDIGATFFVPRWGVEGEVVGRFVGEQHSDLQGTREFLLDDYWLWRAKLSKSFGQHWSVFVTVDNIFDVYYETRRGYFMPGTSFTVGAAARF